MQLSFPFTLLLGSIFCVLVNAAPYERGADRVTMPLAPLRERRSDLPATILLQQHLNTAHRRQARARGLPVPSDAELAAALHRRVEALPDEHYHELARRYNRVGFPAKSSGSSAVSDALIDANSNARAGSNAAKHRNGHKGAGAGAAAGAGAGAGAGAAAGAAGSSNSTSSATDTTTATATDTAVTDAASGTATATSGTTGATNAANPNAGGISPTAVTAQNDDSLTLSNDPGTKGQLALDIEANDVGYVATVQIGTPARDFRLIMDSGSADLWVGAENCATVTQSQRRGLGKRQSATDCGNHTFLGSTTSSTFKDTGKPFQVTYGSGAVAGNIVQDTLSFAGLTLTGHTFGAADQETVQFSGDPNADGLMGLALSTLSNQGVATPPESLATAGDISSAIVSYHIPRLLDGKKDGTVSFGGIDATTVDQSTLVTVDNVSKVGFWETAATFSVNGKDSGLKGRTAIMDTGTTLIIAPDADATALHALIPGAGGDATNGFTVPCTTDASIALTISGQAFTIDPRDILFAPVDPNNLTGDCVSGIQAGTVGTATEWLVGDVFLKNVIFATDATANTLSLAKVAA